MNDAPGTSRVIPNFYQGAGKKGGRSDWKVELLAGQCYWFSAAGDGGIQEISIYLWDPSEHRLGDHKSRTSRSMLTNCPVANGLYHVQVKVLKGEGAYALGVYGKGALPASPPPPAAPPPPRIDFADLLDKRARAVAVGAVRSGEIVEGNGGRGDHTDVSVLMEPGTCYWVIAVGDPKKVPDISLYLWGPDNKRITEAKGSNGGAMVGHCPKDAGMFKAQVKVPGGSGAYAAAIYEKGMGGKAGGRHR